MIKDFEIENFRGIQSLKLEGFSNVNIFVGKPNTGKTSILEALYLYLSKHPDAITNILEFRKTVVDKDCFQGFFYDYDLNNQIILTNDDEELKIHCRNNHYTNIMIDGSQQKDKGVNEMSLEYHKSQSKRTMRISKTFPNPFQIHFQANLTSFENNQINSEKADFVNESNSYENILKRNLETILSNKTNKEVLNKCLKKFSSDIQEISFLDSRVVIQKENLNNVISLKLMGAGFQKYVAIILSILQNKKYIFIDEIENGLHFESIDLLLEAILEASNNVQFFITTHNEELLKHLSVLLENKDKESVAVFNVYIDKDSNIQAGRYSQKSFVFNTEHNNEMRD